MREREFEGVDLEQALHTAAERLGIPEPELDYEIVEQGRRGLFGLGAKNVRIRVMPPLDEEIPDPDSRPRRRRSRRERKPPAAAQATGRGTAPVGQTEGRQATEKQEPPPAARDRDRPEGREARDGRAGDDETTRRRKSRNRRRRDRSRRPRGAESAAPGGGGADAAAAPRPEAGRPARRNEGRRRSRSRKGRSRDAAPPRRVAATPADPEQVAAVRATLQQMIDLMGLEVTIRPDEGAGMRLELDGPDCAALVRRDAELLGALQFVLNRMSRRAWPGAGRIQLTSDGQSSSRDEDVVGIVERAIETLQQTGEPQQLREMNAYERRLVHIAVRKVDGVASSSEGDGHLKCVRIFKRDSNEAAEAPPPDPAVAPPEAE